MMFRLTASHSRCLVFSAGSLAVSTMFMSAVWREESSSCFLSLSTCSALPCLTHLGCAYSPLRSRDMNVSLK